MEQIAEESKGLFQRLVDVFVENQDPRSINWFLSGSPLPLATILGTYLYFCIYAGPKYMANKKPYDLKNVLLIYNAVQVILSIILVHEGLEAGWRSHYNFTCQPVDYSQSPPAMRMLSAVWMYYMCKVIELLDTVFFVLRKKQRQVSFLHLYHHTLMPFAAFIGVKYFGGGHPTLLGVINSFIHVIMYTYYLLAAIGPKMQKYLWWKKYLTIMQMLQFGIIFVHTLQVQFYPNCEFSKGIAALLTLNAALFFYMFASFYINSYHKSSRKSFSNQGSHRNGYATVNAYDSQRSD